MGTKLYLDPTTEKKDFDAAAPEEHSAPDRRSTAPAIRSHADMGAEQGGLLDWFRSKFGRKRRPEAAQPERQLNISAPLRLERNTSEDSLAYMRAMDAKLRKERITHLDVSPTIGKGGGAAEAAAFSATLRGEGGGKNYIEQSNTDLARSRSSALVSLGVRGSSEEAAKQEKLLRGDIFDQLPNDYTRLMLDMVGKGVDTEAMMKEGTVASDFVKTADGKDKEKLAYAYGGGFDELNNKALDLFSSYVLSDESLKYVRDFSEGVAPANVFNGQMRGLTGASGFALQTLINLVGGNINKTATDKRLDGSSQRVAVNMGRTIGSLPKMASLPEENLPASLRPLRARYIALQEEMDRRLAELQ